MGLDQVRLALDLVPGVIADCKANDQEVLTLHHSINQKVKDHLNWIFINTVTALTQQITSL